MTNTACPASALADKIELHLKLDETPGYYLSVEDQQIIIDCLRFTSQYRPAPMSDDPEKQAIIKLVNGFANAVRAKLMLAHANGRRGWQEPDWEHECQQGLLRHVAKGDPRDVAAICAFMWHHNWITVPAAPTTPADGDDAIRLAIWRLQYDCTDQARQEAAELISRLSAEMASARNVREDFAKFFDETQQVVWLSDEVADCLRHMDLVVVGQQQERDERS